MNKRILSLLLALLMLVSLLPMAALAAEAEVITEDNADEIIGEVTGETTLPLDGDGGESTYGTCGDELEWTLEDGVLTISGGGAMADYTAADPAPWNSYSASITTVLIESGVENIGTYAFAGCSALTFVSIPLSVESIGDYAFYGCSWLVNVSYDGTQAQWDALTSGITKGSGNEVLVEANVQCVEDSEFKAVTGEAEISADGTVTLYAYYTFPASERGYEVGMALGTKDEPLYYGDWVQRIYEKMDNGKVAIELDWVYLIPGVTYYYRAYTNNDNGEEIMGEAKTFKAPAREYDDLVVDQSRSMSAREEAMYIFTPDADGTYNLSLSGSGGAVVYDADGQDVKVCVNETEGFTFDFTAQADQTYYIYVESYSTESLTITLTKSGATGGENPTSGTCGENLTWKLEDGTLTISGTGKMTNFGSTDAPKAPWESGSDSIQYVVVEDGVTTVGVQAFSGCEALKSVTLGSSVTTIERNAFVMCTALESITIPASVTKIENYAFSQCAALKDVYYAGTQEQWDAIKISSGNYSLTGATIHIATAAEKVADALDNIAAEATTADEIRAAVQQIDKDDLTEVLASENSAAVIEKMAELESKVGGNVTVEVVDGAGVSGASIVGAALNNVTGDVKLTISAAEQTTLPDTVDSSKAVYLQMELDGVENPSDLKVPVCITIEVPDNIQWELVRLVHHTSDGKTEVLTPTTYVDEKTNVRYARFVIGGFSPFTLTEMAHKAGDVNGKEGVNILDVLALLKYVAGIDSTIVYGDVNNSGKIDILDVLTLLKYVAGISGTTIY